MHWRHCLKSWNPCPISTSQTSVAPIDVLFSNSQIYGRVLVFQIDVSDIDFSSDLSFTLAEKWRHNNCQLITFRPKFRPSPAMNKGKAVFSSGFWRDGICENVKTVFDINWYLVSITHLCSACFLFLFFFSCNLWSYCSMHDSVHKTKNRHLDLFYTDCINPNFVTIRPSLYEIFVVYYVRGHRSEGTYIVEDIDLSMTSEDTDLRRYVFERT
jgi:hypothetical protein